MKTKLAFASLSLFVFGVPNFVGSSIVFGQGEVTSGKERVKEKLPFDVTTGEVDVAKTTKTINTLWTGQNAKEVIIWLWNAPGGPNCCSTKYSSNFYKLNPEKLQYAFPEETELDNIQNPTAYEYQSEYWYPQYPINIVNGKRIPSGWKKGDAAIPVQLSQIIILKLGNKHVAIKPVSVERRYNSLEEMPPLMQAGWKKRVGSDRHLAWTAWQDGLPPYFGWLTYEWRYWENPSPAPKVATMRTQLQKAGLTPQEITFLLKNE